MLIIGITGTLGAGKGTIVEYLVQNYGFQHLSVREYLIQKIQQRGLEVNRDSMVMVANELREKYGAGYIAKELYQQAELSGKNTVIESLRAVGEIDTLKEKGPFYLFAVEAEPAIRYERIVPRGSVTDHLSYTEFISNEEREMQSNDPNKQNLQACIALADYLFHNNGTIEELHEQVDLVMRQIENGGVNSELGL